MSIIACYPTGLFSIIRYTSDLTIKKFQAQTLFEFRRRYFIFYN